MIRRLITYEVRKEALPQALAATRAFVDEVTRKEGGTAAYRVYQHKDPETRFTHYMEFRMPAAEQYHQKTAWRKKFEDAMGPLRTGAPVVADVTLVE